MVTFASLRARLVKRVKLRIDNGEFTERGLARILGISQSQTHNVLKGARGLHIQLADRILMKLGLSTLDLLSESELDAALKLRMEEWDRQMAVSNGEAEESYFANLQNLKKPVCSEADLTRQSVKGSGISKAAPAA